MKTSDIQQAITERIGQLIVARQITRYKLSKETGILEATLSRNVRGKGNWTPEQLKKIAEYFGVTVDYLIYGSNFEEMFKDKLMKELNNLKTENKKLLEEAASYYEIKKLINKEPVKKKKP